MATNWTDADHIASSEGGYEAQRQNHFLVEFHGVPNAEVLRLSLRTSDLPPVGFEEIEIPWLNERRFVPGRFRTEPITITFNDYLDPNTANVIMEWNKLVGDPETGKIFPLKANRYKVDGTLYLLGPDGSTQRSWKLQGCWPQQTSMGSVDMSATDIVQIEVTFRVDKYIPNLST